MSQNEDIEEDDMYGIFSRVCIIIHWCFCVETVY